jgi:hypothetical protein
MLPLHRNGSFSVVAGVFVAARMSLPSRCSATGLHASTIQLPLYREIKSCQ